MCVFHGFVPKVSNKIAFSGSRSSMVRMRSAVRIRMSAPNDSGFYPDFILHTSDYLLLFCYNRVIRLLSKCIL